ncbi:hypothetical protein FB45DRAFT_1060565 [Roridomyces roridus]|uniref:F-box domain-containing protein n=1 Tax=Roridomyces roridus TaxID=1738132 RepID=A0AAD7FL38_9AGAR|nr:hypothetical protein FB45DRAFT_1060565 [Roridomyces roridus]
MSTIAKQIIYLRRQIAPLSSLLAPIRRLPRELLSEIFLQPSLHTPIPPFPKFAHRGTDAILSVSHYWRETILSTAEFWAEFDVALPGNSNGARLLELSLERSKLAPLSIAILAWNAGMSWHPRILQLLISSCERWANLYLAIESSYLPLLSPLRGHLPLLASLDLQLHKERRPTSTPQLLATTRPDAFEIAPRLTKLELGVLFTSTIPVLPRSGISTLIISNWDSLPFVGDFRNLHTLSFSPASGFAIQDLASISLSRPAAEISASVLFTFPIMLKFITAPAVQFLDIATSGSSITLGMNVWTPFLRRSACRPHTLQLHNLSIPWRDLFSMLTDLPTLQTLLLRDLGRADAITTDLLTQFTLGTGTVILPELADLTIAGSYFFTNASLLGMLESRSDSFGRVKIELKLRIFTAEELDRARALKEKGMVLTLWCLDADKMYVRMI